jgi:hypothetical protein
LVKVDIYVIGIKKALLSTEALRLLGEYKFVISVIFFGNEKGLYMCIGYILIKRKEEEKWVVAP